MRLRWTPEAAHDLETIYQYLQENLPEYAERTVTRIYREISGLRRFPLMGQPLERSGVRGLLLDERRYICVYRIRNEAIHLLHIFHTAQERPKTFQ